MNELIKILRKIKHLRYEAWLRDIPSSTIPEYQEHHRDIQSILFLIDGIIEYIEAKIEEEDY